MKSSNTCSQFRRFMHYTVNYVTIWIICVQVLSLKMKEMPLKVVFENHQAAFYLFMWIYTTCRDCIACPCYSLVTLRDQYVKRRIKEFCSYREQFHFLSHIFEHIKFLLLRLNLLNCHHHRSQNRDPVIKRWEKMIYFGYFNRNILLLLLNLTNVIKLKRIQIRPSMPWNEKKVYLRLNR